MVDLSIPPYNDLHIHFTPCGEIARPLIVTYTYGTGAAFMLYRYRNEKHTFIKRYVYIEIAFVDLENQVGEPFISCNSNTYVL